MKLAVPGAVRVGLRVVMVAPPARPADGDIREALFARIRHTYGEEADTVCLEELGLCRARVFVDVVVVNGVLHGYEIKSDRDSLRRLKSQVAMYGRVLDCATLVVGERHLAEAAQSVPAWWEVLVARGSHHSVELELIQEGAPNPTRDPRAIVELLWMEEALAMLEARRAARGCSRGSRRRVWDRVCEVYALDEIAAAVRSHLKARQERRVVLTFA